MIYYDAKEAVKEMRKHGFDIVRCKDCKHHYPDCNTTTLGGDLIAVYCEEVEYYVEPNWFCADGAKMDEVKK